MPQLIRETSSALRGIILGAYVVALIFCGAGVWLVYLGARGSTEFSFFGQSFKSTNVGIAALFLGAAAVVLLVLRFLRTLDSAIKGQTPLEAKDSAPSKHWLEKMPNYSFRVRFLRSPSDTLNIDAPQWEWHLGEATPALVLCSHKQEEPIKESKQLLFKSEGWSSPDDAAVAAAKYTDALALSLARLRVGADFGSRAPKGAFTNAGLAMLKAQIGQRILNDVHGLMVYESEPPPRFASARLDAVRGVPQDRFERVFSHAIDHPRELSERERLSLELFNASFFQNSADSRFLMLVMAIEALLNLTPRSSAATAHVEALMRETQECVELLAQEKDSLLGSLRWLLWESINQTGRSLAEDRLGPRVYAGRKAPSFFSFCYDLRSRLVHGERPFPTQDEIGSAAAQLEVFVSDLLAGEVLEVQLS